MSDTDEQGPDDTLTDAVKATAKPVEKATADQAPAAEEATTEEGQTAPAPDPDPTDDDTAPAVRDDGKPFTRKDHAALTEALGKARKDAREQKAEAARLTAAAGGKDVASVVAEADTRAMEKFKPLMVKAAARSAFTEAGLTLPAGRADEVFARVVKLLDSEALTITDDGLVEGLAEQVEAIRADFPDLFAGSAPRRAPRIPAADRPGSTPPKTSAERLAASLIGAA